MKNDHRIVSLCTRSWFTNEKWPKQTASEYTNENYITLQRAACENLQPPAFASSYIHDRQKRLHKANTYVPSAFGKITFSRVSVCFNLWVEKFSTPWIKSLCCFSCFTSTHTNGKRQWWSLQLRVGFFKRRVNTRTNAKQKKKKRKREKALASRSSSTWNDDVKTYTIQEQEPNANIQRKTRKKK
jgi:hypothetical protein